jgi:hypothetical protein
VQLTHSRSPTAFVTSPLQDTIRPRKNWFEVGPLLRSGARGGFCGCKIATAVQTPHRARSSGAVARDTHCSDCNALGCGRRLRLSLAELTVHSCAWGPCVRVASQLARPALGRRRQGPATSSQLPTNGGASSVATLVRGRLQCPMRAYVYAPCLGTQPTRCQPLVYLQAPHLTSRLAPSRNNQ